VKILERVATARERAREETWTRVAPLLTLRRQAELDEMLAVDPVPAAARRRRGGLISEDKPKIRLHRYERILAVKWPGNEHWLMIWPAPYPDLAPPGTPAAQTEWNRLVREGWDRDTSERGQGAAARDRWDCAGLAG
jgi:hypothetical protein